MATTTRMLGHLFGAVAVRSSDAATTVRVLTPAALGIVYSQKAAAPAPAPASGSEEYIVWARRHARR